eukprot:2915208-Amphidinium_carterae.1
MHSQDYPVRGYCCNTNFAPLATRSTTVITITRCQVNQDILQATLYCAMQVHTYACKPRNSRIYNT